MTFKTAEEFSVKRSTKEPRVSKVIIPTMTIRRYDSVTLNRAVTKGETRVGHRGIVEVDTESRIVRVKIGNVEGNILSTFGDISAPSAMVRELGYKKGGSKVRIPLEFNTEDGWWYGSY